MRRTREILCSLLTSVVCVASLVVGSAFFAEACHAAPDPMRVGLLVSAPVDDHGWNQIGFEGLQRIAKELGAEVVYRQVGSAEERVEGLRAYAGQGFQLVFGHGEEYGVPVAQVAPEFPKTIFVTTGGETVMPNAAPIRLAMEEATYLLGILAAGVSRAGQAGLIGGEDLVAIRRA